MPSGYRFRRVDDADANEAARRRYEPPCGFYDSVAGPQALAELLDPERREGVYFWGPDEEGDLAGFFQFEERGTTVELGPGLRPDLTGKGLGLGFLLAGMGFAPEGFRLTVAAFNERATRIYGRAYFRRCEASMHDTNGGRPPFLSTATAA